MYEKIKKQAKKKDRQCFSITDLKIPILDPTNQQLQGNMRESFCSIFS